MRLPSLRRTRRDEPREEGRNSGYPGWTGRTIADEPTLEQPRVDLEADREFAQRRYEEGWEAGVRDAERRYAERRDAEHRSPERGGPERGGPERGGPEHGEAGRGDPGGPIAGRGDAGRSAAERGGAGGAEGEPGQHRGLAAAQIDRAAEDAAAATRTAAAVAAADQALRRPRTSILAVLGLILAVLAAAAVLTGALALIGLVAAVVAALLALGGLARTRRRRVAGRVIAGFALVLALITIGFGVLVLAGVFGWLDTGTNQVAELHDWLPSWLT